MFIATPNGILILRHNTVCHIFSFIICKLNYNFFLSDIKYDTRTKFNLFNEIIPLKTQINLWLKILLFTGVCHCDDLLYLFYCPILFPDYPEGHPDIKMIEALTTLWTNFAKYGYAIQYRINNFIQKFEIILRPLFGFYCELFEKLKLVYLIIYCDVWYIQDNYRYVTLSK